MRTDNYQNWLDSLEDEEYEDLVYEYGEDDMRRAYNDCLEKLAEDFSNEVKENEELR